MRLNFAIFLTVLAVASVNDARSLYRRQVPQEHSHEALLTAMRAIMPAGTPSIQGDGNIPDVVFGLLGNKAAGDQAPTKGAAGGICLQQDIADTAIGLAAGDKTKIATALKYRALERNSGSVGGKSDLCTKAPKSKELVGLTQHQDAASEGAAAFNKNVEITLAKKLGELGIDPLQALETVTFGPGQKGDPTAKGLSCNEETDKAGCIFTKKLNVAAATEAELLAAGGGAGGAGTAAATAGTGGAGTGAGAAGGATGGAAAGGDSQAIIDSMIAELEQLKTLCAAA